MVAEPSILDLPIDVRANIQRIIAYHRPELSTASFDYCLNYFRSFADAGRQKEIASDEHMHRSCLELGWFLANWGMLRGASFLRMYGITHFKPIIRYIAECDERLWHIDIDSYTEENINLLVQSKKDIQRILGLDKAHNVTDTLTTKMMMAAFGNVPAFDRYFRQGLGLSGCNNKSLHILHLLYLRHRSAFDQVNVYTFDVLTGKPTSRPYPKARLMDIVGFVQGGGGAEK